MLYQDSEKTIPILMQSFKARYGVLSYTCQAVPGRVYVNGQLTTVQVTDHLITFFTLPQEGAEIVVLFNPNLTLVENKELAVHLTNIRGALVAGDELTISLDNVTFHSALNITVDGIIYLKPVYSGATSFINRLILLQMVVTTEILPGSFSVEFINNSSVQITLSGLAEGIEYHEV